MNEFFLFEVDNSVIITNAEIIIGEKIYAIAGIESVSLEEKSLAPTTGKILVIMALISSMIGILFCMAALSIRFISIVKDFADHPRIILHFLVAVIGLLFLYLGSLGWESDRPTYWVQIKTASASSKIFQTKDKAYVERIITAIKQEIVPRMNGF